MDTPLIYTCKGNLPVADLEYRHYWFEDDLAITFKEEYLLNGEVVRSNAHCRLKKGLDTELQQQLFGA